MQLITKKPKKPNALNPVDFPVSGNVTEQTAEPQTVFISGVTGNSSVSLDRGEERL